MTRRLVIKRNSFDLVYEWEDQMVDEFGASLCFNPTFGMITKGEKPIIRIGFKLFDLIYRPFVTNKLAICFEMNPAWRSCKSVNKKNIIPWIIDFYLKDPNELESFYQRFNKHQLILISSKEVYDFLVQQHCPLNIVHLALSISDKLRITPETTFEKQFDILLMGRQNPVLLDMLSRYKKKHKISIVTCRKEDGHFNYYTEDGEFVGNADSRKDCLELLKKSKIGFYSTQGLDGDNRSKKAHGFSQVTPRFLEYIATGNHVIARYADNSDVDYYEMNRICPNTQSYEQFEEQMDKALSEPVDMKLYSDYLAKHYMSERVKLLKTIKLELDD